MTNPDPRDTEQFEEEDFVDEPWPHSCHDMSDDADALASIGWGTDEDYGCIIGGDSDLFGEF